MKKSFKSGYMNGLSEYLYSANSIHFKNDYNFLVHPYKSKNFISNLSFLKKKKISNIIDIGCGIGALISFYDILDFKKCILTDINLNFLNLCKKLIKETNSKKNYDCKKINIFNIETHNKYDLVVCAGMINYFEKNLQLKVLDKISKISKKHIAIEIIYKKSLFHKIFIIFENNLMKKICYLLYFILNIFSQILKIFGRSKLYLFILKCSILAENLSSNLPQAKNIYSKNFYIDRLKKNNFNLKKEFSYNSLITIFFEKN